MSAGGQSRGSPALSVQVEQDENRDLIEREGSSGPVPRLLPVRDRGGARSRQSEAPQGLALIPRAGAAPKVRKNPKSGALCGGVTWIMSNGTATSRRPPSPSATAKIARFALPSTALRSCL